MCGLAGIARLDGTAVDAGTERLLGRMAAVLAHRGPDDEQVLSSGEVGLAFRRLAIVDPAGGRQPLVSPDGSVVLVVNGEIYNHRELARTLPPDRRPRTGSDCAVLLPLYQRHGLDFLDRVRGMFALALWDRRRRRLLLARDRFGIKPLFLTRDRRRLAFASEMKALFADPACPRELDWDSALTDPALDVGSALDDGPPRTWFRGIEQVPAGSLIDVDLGTGELRRHTYWSLPEIGADGPATGTSDDASDASFVERYRALLSSSVAECATADAPVGLFLSGGVDSAGVAALAARDRDIRAFTVRAGSTVRSGDLAAARRVAHDLGLPLHELDLSGDEAPDAHGWRRLLWHQESPLCDLDQWYKFLLHGHAKAVDPGLKVMLLGQGSDEFNGGYSPRFAQDWDGFLSVLGMLWRQYAARGRPGLGMWARSARLPLLTAAGLERVSQVPVTDPYELFVRAKHRDLQQYNCWHEDRTASAHGVEARVPFLDHRLVELVLSVPAGSRRRLLWNKRVLRDALAPVLPQDIVERPKEPFVYTGDGGHAYRLCLTMLTRDGGALLEEALAGPHARELIDAKSVRATLAGIAEGRLPAHRSQTVLRLINLGLLDHMTATWSPPALTGGQRVTAMADG
ncbi:asparagine synthase (glutamine-hydrolyzing) [Streptomyces sp. URMC 123]|uniref:asparagine synthase (glutamine-hydrolyzing) n=1 Tax=Streptomyces sp. URMC 123 TaxID=3423403 RepID=UPI003F1E124D